MTETSFQELVNRRKESGLTIRDFCSNEGIHESTYYYWFNKLNKRATQPKEFIPLMVGNHLPTPRKNQILRSDTASSEMHSQDNNQLEFVFPNGTRLIVRNPVDLSIMQAIVHLYD